MDAAAAFAVWQDFYIIVGSSAGALTGLQFVVMALVAERPMGSAQDVNAFGTPTVVHFGATLLISAILAAPWHRLGSAGVALAICGALGCAYSAIVIRRARRTKYTPLLEDWLFFVVFPLIAYVDLLLAAIVLQRSPGPALFAIGGAALVLLFVGIRNAWDTVVYIALTRNDESRPETHRPPPKSERHRRNRD